MVVLVFDLVNWPVFVIFNYSGLFIAGQWVLVIVI